MLLNFDCDSYGSRSYNSEVWRKLHDRLSSGRHADQVYELHSPHTFCFSVFLSFVINIMNFINIFTFIDYFESLIMATTDDHDRRPPPQSSALLETSILFISDMNDDHSCPLEVEANKHALSWPPLSHLKRAMEGQPSRSKRYRHPSSIYPRMRYPRKDGTKKNSKTSTKR